MIQISSNPIAPFPRNGTWNTYTPADGLAGLQVDNLAQDNDGWLWIGTLTGASRFDGDTFETFNSRNGLCGDQVYALCPDRQGRVWVGLGDGGVCRYHNGQFVQLAANDGPLQSGIRYLLEDQHGRMWCAGSAILGWFEGDVYRDLMPELETLLDGAPGDQRPFFWSIVEDAAGVLWFRDIFDPVLLCYDGDQLLRIRLEGPVRGGFDMACHPSGGLWVAASEGEGSDLSARLWHYDGQTCTNCDVDVEGAIRRIVVDSSHRTWLATTAGGVMYEESGGFRQFSVAEGLPYPTVNSVLEDEEGQFWFGTWGGGITCYDPSGIQLFGEEEGIPTTEASALCEDRQGRIWMGFGSGSLHRSYDRSADSGQVTICRLDGSSAWVPSGEHGLQLTSCCGIVEGSGGEMCFVGPEGVANWSGSRFTNTPLPDSLDGGLINSVALARDGTVLLGMGTSEPHETFLLRWTGDQFEILLRQTIGSNFLFALLESRDGEILFAPGTRGGQWAGKGVGRTRCGVQPGSRTEPEFLTTADGLVHDRVSDLMEDRSGNLWVGTRGGLSRYDGQGFVSYTTDDGLPNNHIRCLCEAADGRLWLGTDAGVVQFDGEHFQTIRSPDIAPVNRIIEDHRGAYWFATLNGVVRYQPAGSAPRVRITRVLADQVHEQAEAVEVCAPTRQLIFEFSGMGFRTPPSDMLYQWKMEGFDEDWQSAARERVARYQDLPEGEYSFQVKALDRDLNESEVAAIPVTVLPDPLLEGFSHALSQNGAAGEFVGNSEALRAVQSQLIDVAPSDLTVLILGETGTGKGLAARSVHAYSGRQSGPFIQVSCGAMPEGLVESELFGHEKGAFTGAHSRRLGKVELAAKGTLFLDEIGDMPLAAQVKLLRLLEEGTFERVGGASTHQAAVRVIAATNRDLDAMVADGTFREDLYFRLRVFPVRLPPLRDRVDDIPLLAAYFLEQMATHLSKRVTRLGKDAISALRSYHWPGNVRELEHVIRRAVVICRESAIRVSDLGLEIGPGPGSGDSGLEGLTLEQVERTHIRNTLEKSRWVIAGPRGAAALLGLKESTLRFRMKKLGIERP